MNQFYTKEMSENPSRFGCFDEHRVIVPVKNCGHKEKLPYAKWFPWAERQVKNGRRQIQCFRCKLWFFTEEL